MQLTRNNRRPDCFRWRFWPGLRRCNTRILHKTLMQARATRRQEYSMHLVYLPSVQHTCVQSSRDTVVCMYVKVRNGCVLTNVGNAIQIAVAVRLQRCNRSKTRCDKMKHEKHVQIILLPPIATRARANCCPQNTVSDATLVCNT